MLVLTTEFPHVFLSALGHSGDGTIRIPKRALEEMQMPEIAARIRDCRHLYTFDSGTRVTLHKNVTVGRDAYLLIPSYYANVSRQHCLLFHSDDHWWIAQCHNYEPRAITVAQRDGTAIVGKDPVRLKAGDRVRLADSFEFVVAET